MRRAAPAVVIALAVLLGGSACSKKGAKKLDREGDAAPVVVVERGAVAQIPLVDEVEPNDERAAATALPAGSGARGSLDGETDVDFYRIAPAEPAQLTAIVGGLAGVDLILEVQDAKGKVLARSDRGPAETAEGVPNLWLEPGEYYLAVREFVKKRKKGQAGREGASPPYELRVELTPQPAERHEREPNDKPAGATELVLGDEHLGWIGWNDDVDHWKLSLEGFTSHYGLDFDLLGVPGVWLRLEVLDAAGKKILERKGEEGESVSVRGLAPDEAQKHYVLKVSGRRSNPLDTYTLGSRTRLLDLDEEIEPNDTAERATALRETSAESDGRRRGTLSQGDIDFYRLEAVGQPMLLTLQVSPAGDLDVAVEVQSGRGGVLSGANAGGAGAREEMAALPIAAGTPVLVKVTGTSRGGSSEYELRWSVQPDDRGAPEPSLDDFGYDDD